MKKAKKKVAVTLLATMVVVGSVNAYAASHKTGCSSTLERVECIGPYNYNQFGYHVLYETVNGQVRCIKTAMYGAHEIYCSNSSCGVLLETTSRTHEVHHTYCPPETGVCQKPSVPET